MVKTKTLGGGNDNFKAERTIRKPKPFNPFNKEFDNWDINGGAGNDTLTGGDKRDSLRGGTGRDSLLGRQGDDRYFVDRSDDIIVERSGEGDDLVFSKAISFALPDHVENLDIDEPNIFRASAFGNSLDNDIFGADTTQEDFISGVGGNDRLSGFANRDTLLGGSGNDTLSGGTGNDSLDGGTGNDSLDGGAGNDTLRGSAAFVTGNELDTLIGGSGTDHFILGTGNSSFYDNNETSDFARIKDFRLDSDKLQLAGSRSDYEIAGNVLRFGNDVIAVFEGHSATSLTAALDNPNITKFG